MSTHFHLILFWLLNFLNMQFQAVGIRHMWVIKFLLATEYMNYLSNSSWVIVLIWSRTIYQFHVSSIKVSSMAMPCWQRKYWIYDSFSAIHQAGNTEMSKIHRTHPSESFYLPCSISLLLWKSTETVKICQ